MSDLVKLTAKEAIRLYQVNKGIAEQPSYHFYSSPNMPRSEFDDDPWSLIAISEGQRVQDNTSIQLCTVHQEFLEFDDFDPLTDPFCGYINLNANRLTQIGKILLSHSVVSENFKQTTGVVNNVQRIEEAQFDYYHLNHYNFPQSHRLYWLFHDHENPAIIKLVSCSGSIVLGPYVQPQDRLRYLLDFREFHEKRFSESKFTPLDHALSKITLNRKEIVELVSIFGKII